MNNDLWSGESVRGRFPGNQTHIQTHKHIQSIQHTHVNRHKHPAVSLVFPMLVTCAGWTCWMASPDHRGARATGLFQTIVEFVRRGARCGHSRGGTTDSTARMRTLGTGASRGRATDQERIEADRLADVEQLRSSWRPKGWLSWIGASSESASSQKLRNRSDKEWASWHASLHLPRDEPARARRALRERVGESAAARRSVKWWPAGQFVSLFSCRWTCLRERSLIV